MHLIKFVVVVSSGLGEKLQEYFFHLRPPPIVIQNIAQDPELQCLLKVKEDLS